MDHALGKEFHSTRTARWIFHRPGGFPTSGPGPTEIKRYGVATASRASAQTRKRKIPSEIDTALSSAAVSVQAHNPAPVPASLRANWAVH